LRTCWSATLTPEPTSNGRHHVDIRAWHGTILVYRRGAALAAAERQSSGARGIRSLRAEIWGLVTAASGTFVTAATPSGSGPGDAKGAPVSSSEVSLVGEAGLVPHRPSRSRVQ
jgi:hypothetical protein